MKIFIISQEIIMLWKKDNGTAQWTIIHGVGIAIMHTILRRHLKKINTICLFLHNYYYLCT